MLRNNRTHHIVGKKSCQFGSDIWHHVSKRRFSSGFFRFFGPKINNCRIGAFIQFHPTKIFIRQNFWNFHKSGTRLRIFHHQKHSVSHILFKHWSSSRFKIIQLIKNSYHLIDNKSFLLRMSRIIFHHIESKRTFYIGWIKINYIFCSIFGDGSQNFFYCVSMRINKTKSLSIARILFGHFLQNSSFTGSSLTNCVKMSSTIIFCQTNIRFRSAIFIKSH